MQINNSSNMPGWRTVYNPDTKQVITLCYFANGITSSIYTIFEATTKEECLAEIAKLNLIYIEEEENE